MTIDERIPAMSEKELENLRANAERIIKSGGAKQQADAERVLPLIADALAAHKVARTAELAEKKQARAKGLAATRARKAAARKAETEEVEIDTD
jgi:hypothetical protein